MREFTNLAKQDMQRGVQESTGKTSVNNIHISENILIRTVMRERKGRIRKV